MNLTATQIEDIVRVVVERLLADAVAQLVVMKPVKSTEPHLAETISVSRPVGEVHLSDRVVTLESLKGQLDGAKSVVVHPKAVVTPAAKDLLRQQSIRLVRQLPAADAKSSRPAPLLLVTNPSQHALLSKRVCPQQATTIAANDAVGGVLKIAEQLAEQKLGAVWCSEAPFASVAATYGHSQLRAMQLFDVRDLSRAIDQAQPNVLILDSRTWNPSAIANLVSTWFRSLR